VFSDHQQYPLHSKFDFSRNIAFAMYLDIRYV